MNTTVAAFLYSKRILINWGYEMIPEIYIPTYGLTINSHGRIQKAEKADNVYDKIIRNSEKKLDIQKIENPLIPIELPAVTVEKIVLLVRLKIEKSQKDVEINIKGTKDIEINILTRQVFLDLTNYWIKYSV